MRIITVVESKSLLGTFHVSYKDDADNKATQCQDCNGCEAAAAKAMDLAISVDRYIIFAPKNTLEQIPENLRSK